MARPTLPLEEQAAIERIREGILRHAVVTYDLLFPRLSASVSRVEDFLRPHLAKPANLKMELGEYSSNLFDAEAQYYAKHSHNESELRHWLLELANSIVYDISPDRSEPYDFAIAPRIKLRASALDFHCQSWEQTEAMRDALAVRIEHWVQAAKDHSGVSLVWSHNAANSTFKRMAEILETPVRLEDPPPRPIGDPPAIQRNNLGARLDEIVQRDNISHEELAHRIGVSRASYFAVKGGHGGRKSRRKVDDYLAKPNPNVD
jgi:hypothetical protein